MADPGKVSAVGGVLKLTGPRLRILEAAMRHERGLVERPYLTGFERVSWDRNALAMCGAGLLLPYLHGGYEITQRGRDVWAGADTSQGKEGPGCAP